MKIVISPDSFKGSLSAVEAAQAMAAGIRALDLSIETLLLPVADGGEGTLDSLISATQGKTVSVIVSDPLERKIFAEYGILGDGETCVIEMAKASGLMLLKTEERNPLCATSYGTGELILHALDKGFRKFIVGIGGSATNDGGTGMLKALGMKFLNLHGEEIMPGGGALQNLVLIDQSQFDSRLAESEFIIASDVDNPFVGPNGASFVFGPQKGATEEMVAVLDRNLNILADVIERTAETSIHNREGAGAAGGMGGAFQSFFPSKMKPGIQVVMEAMAFRDCIHNVDLIITGEGKSDSQTLSGKAPFGIAKVAKDNNVPVLLISGSVSIHSKQQLARYFHSITSVVDEEISPQDSMENAEYYLKIKTQEAVLNYLQIE
ncbi:glycerate kinase [Paenisporosarcina indica]|uniref:glycerate kinase n=1 Tax=Paenisporosarcina indica TaxID=650093 RepID=UPI00094FFC31|nr:glycerate kinase [Paenisporosarcina indica]